MEDVMMMYSQKGYMLDIESTQKGKEVVRALL